MEAAGHVRTYRRGRHERAGHTWLVATCKRSLRAPGSPGTRCVAGSLTGLVRWAALHIATTGPGLNIGRLVRRLRTKACLRTPVRCDRVAPRPPPGPSLHACTPSRPRARTHARTDTPGFLLPSPPRVEPVSRLRTATSIGRRGAAWPGCVRAESSSRRVASSSVPCSSIRQPNNNQSRKHKQEADRGWDGGLCARTLANGGHGIWRWRERGWLGGEEKADRDSR